MSKAQQLVQQLNVPQQIQNDPHQIVNFLMQNGKISQDKLNWAMQIAQKMGVKL
jgi:hypothetical protein